MGDNGSKTASGQQATNDGTSDPALDETIARLNASFARKLTQRLAELDSALESIRASAGAAEDLAHAHALAHKLYGSAGSFGFPGVSREVRVIEDLLLDIIEKRLSFDDAVWQKLTRAGERVRANAGPES